MIDGVGRTAVESTEQPAFAESSKIHIRIDGRGRPTKLSFEELSSQVSAVVEHIRNGTPLNDAQPLSEEALRRGLQAAAGEKLTAGQNSEALERFKTMQRLLLGLAGTAVVTPSDIVSSQGGLTIEVLPWGSEARCAQAEPETFFPEKGGSTREAKRVCAGCKARQRCLDFALDNDERFGIWGGLSERATQA